MKRHISFFILILLLSVGTLFFTGSRKWIFNQSRQHQWAQDILAYDTSATLITDTLESETFSMGAYPYSAVQVAITSDDDSLLLFYKCSQVDSASHWAIAEMESVGVVGTLTDDRMRIFGNSDHLMPTTRYAKYYLIPLTAGIDFKVWFIFWRD